MKKSILFRKKWLLHLLTTTTAFLFLLFLSGTRSETLFSGTTSRNIPLALDLVAACQHPDARWLTEACAGKDVTTKEDAKRIFSSLG